jgi:sulfur carrier protein
MHILLNGNDTQVEAGLDLAALIQRLGLAGQRVAVEVNAELVPRSRFETHALEDGDRVEIIHAVGGG